MLHTLHDGSALKVINAKELVRIPVWHGNRIIDISHVQKIKKGINGNVQKLDNGYRIVTYKEKDAGGNYIQNSCIIDGQHRHRVLSDHFQESLCEPDFPIVVLEKHVDCEAEIITCFKELNNQMPILWKSDPNMVANEYIKELSLVFNSKRDSLIRSKPTTRPYLSAERLREGLVLFSEQLKDAPADIKMFVERVIKYNEKQLNLAEMNALHSKKGLAEILGKAFTHKFMLAVDPKLPWIRECLIQA